MIGMLLIITCIKDGKWTILEENQVTKRERTPRDRPIQT